MLAIVLIQYNNKTQSMLILTERIKYNEAKIEKMQYINDPALRNII